jgi:segregation and condensation protein A
MSVQHRLNFEADPDDFEAARDAAEEGEALVLDLDGFEGPLHLLLELARRQKVDLLTLSVAKLADQYLAFVAAARRKRFALAADYLVMAAWLAYLKSRLLLPKPEKAKADEPPPEALARALAARLAALDAVRKGVEALQTRPQLGRDVFMRGDPEAVTVISTTRMRGDLHALVSAYAFGRAREATRRYAPERRVSAYPLEAARDRLRTLLPELAEWAPLDVVAPVPAAGGPGRASCLASTLSAGLEMVKEGALEARQHSPFATLYLKATTPP